MRDHPILFSAPMVRALIAGTKTQTRRILKPQPYPLEGRPGFWNASGVVGGRICISDRDLLNLHRKPKPGDRIYVREAIRAVDDQDTYDFQIEYIADGDRYKVAEHDDRSSDAYGKWWNLLAYRSDDPDLTGGKIVPPMHMPRWASRITLIVEDVKVERLQDISEEDAIAEGVVKAKVPFEYDVGDIDQDWYAVPGFDDPGTGISAVDMYATLWNGINGEGSWQSNPWIVAYSFRRIMGNIDQIGGGDGG